MKQASGIPLEKLCCPLCAKQNWEATADGLLCKGCTRFYPMKAGVLCMLVDRGAADLQSPFSDQWRRKLEGSFERQGRTFLLSDQMLVDYWLRDTRELGETLGRGSWILDAGCGSGEKMIALAQKCPDTEIVALDFSDSVFGLKEKAAALPNIHVIQADLTALPFVPASFDHIVSLGVLHHTHDPAKTFASVALRVKEGGSFTTWIYPAWKESPLFMKAYYAIRDILFLGMGHRMRAGLRFALSLGLALPVAIIARSLLRMNPGLVPRRFYEGLRLMDWLKGIAFVIYDDVGPRFQFRIPNEEVLSWYRRLGFRASALPELGLFRGIRGRRSAFDQLAVL